MSNKNNQLKIPIFCIAVISASGLVTFQAKAVEGNGQISAIIKQAISITEQQALTFGKITSGSLQSVISFSPNSSDVVVNSGNAQILQQSANFGVFGITADLTSTINISVPTEVTLSNGSGSTITFNPSTNTQTTISEESQDGSIIMGGSLIIGASQASGNYTGAYTVTATY